MASEVFQFAIKRHGETFTVTFTIGEGRIDATCTCKLGRRKLCVHKQAVLSGRTNRMSVDDHQKQAELVRLLAKSVEGRQMLHEAGSKPEKERCRRCNSEHVVDLKRSRWAKFLSLFVPGGRRYFCLSCRWSW